MTDRIVLAALTFDARHGVHEHEKATAQRFEVDVELELDLGPAGRSDDLAATVDYGDVARLAREVLDGPPVDLIETLAERLAVRMLDRFAAAAAVIVRVRKPDVRLASPLAYAGVEIRRERGR